MGEALIMSLPILGTWKDVFVSSEREAPRRKAVASAKPFPTYFVAASVRLHGARPWHPQKVPRLFLCSGEREAPRRKAVASAKPFPTYFVAASVNLHGARPWHPHSTRKKNLNLHPTGS